MDSIFIKKCNNIVKKPKVLTGNADIHGKGTTKRKLNYGNGGIAS